MRDGSSETTATLVVAEGAPVVAVPLTEDGREVVRYAVDTAARVTATGNLPEAVRDALGLAGAWSDLDWDETVEALDRIRHQSRPTPPVQDP